MKWRRAFGRSFIGIFGLGIVWVMVSFLAHPPIEESKVHPAIVDSSGFEYIRDGGATTIWVTDVQDVVLEFELSPSRAEIDELVILEFRDLTSGDNLELINETKYPHTRRKLAGIIESHPGSDSTEPSSMKSLSGNPFSQTRWFTQFTVSEFIRQVRDLIRSIRYGFMFHVEHFD